MPRQLKGTLEDLHTTQLFHLINLTKKTGMLHVYDGVATGREIIMGDGETKRPEVVPGKERIRIAFREGKLIHATSGEQDNHLSSVLHKSGKLTDEQYRVIRQKAANYSDRALALLLINANYVTQNEVVQSVQQQTLGIVYDVMTWNKEPFSFEEGEQPPGDRITVPIDLGEVIREGTRINTNVKRLIDELPNLDFRLKFPDAAPTDKLKQTKLTREEWQVLGYVTGQNSIRQIAKVCSMNDTEIRQWVSGLLNSGLVELVKPASAPATSSRPGSQRQIKPQQPQREVIDRIINRIKNA